MINGCVLPAPEMLIQDVTAHDVGCCVVNKENGRNQLVNSVIIQKNTPIPCRKIDSFYLEHTEQTEVQIEILQGRAGVVRDDCLIIGELSLSNLPKENIRSERICVEYILDSNAMVKATATDKISGQQQTISLDYKKGIKPCDKPDTV